MDIQNGPISPSWNCIFWISPSFNECVEDEEVPDVEPAGTMAAIAFIQQENGALTDCKLEIRRLAQL